LINFITPYSICPFYSYF